jgi:hypothetical protein
MYAAEMPTASWIVTMYHTQSMLHTFHMRSRVVAWLDRRFSCNLCYFRFFVRPAKDSLSWDVFGPAICRLLLGVWVLVSTVKNVIGTVKAYASKKSR